MAKLPDNVWKIMGECLKLYFVNILRFSQFMLFPVLGQIISVIVVVGFSVVLGNNADIWALKYPIFNNFVFTLGLLLIVTIPFMIIMLKAFWDYIVAYGALNSMADAVMNTGKLYDFKAHRQMVTNKLGKFLLLLLIISIYFLLAVNPLFWVIAGIFFVYFILVFQIFIFEPDLSVADIFKKSFNTVKGNFARTFLLIVFAGIFLYALYALVIYLFALIKADTVFLGMFETFAMSLPLQNANEILSGLKIPQITELQIANEIYKSFIFAFVAGITLPMRSILWSIWYKVLAKCEKPLKHTKKKKTDRSEE